MAITFRKATVRVRMPWWLAERSYETISGSISEGRVAFVTLDDAKYISISFPEAYCVLSTDQDFEGGSLESALRREKLIP